MVMVDVEALDAIANKAERRGELGPAVQARKARSAIIDKLYDRGMEAGVINRAAKETVVVGGIVIASLTESELYKKMADISGTSRRLMDSYGEQSFLDAGFLDAEFYAADLPIDAPELSQNPKQKAIK